MLYPKADRYIPWQGPAVYAGNEPLVVVVHVGQGWMRTWDRWAETGYDQASFHFGAGLTGAVHQYLRTSKGGAHAGRVRKPTATLINELLPFVNLRSIGIEHEGFSSGKTPEGVVLDQFNDTQLMASAAATRWACDTHAIPKDRDHIIGHYEIDGVDRANDPGPLFPWNRFMDFVLEEDTLSAADIARIDRLERLVAGYGYGRKPSGDIDLFGEEALIAADTMGSSLFLGFGDDQAKLAKHEANHGALPPGTKFTAEVQP